MLSEIIERLKRVSINDVHNYVDILLHELFYIILFLPRCIIYEICHESCILLMNCWIYQSISKCCINLDNQTLNILRVTEL